MRRGQHVMVDTTSLQSSDVGFALELDWFVGNWPKDLPTLCICLPLSLVRAQDVHMAC